MRTSCELTSIAIDVRSIYGPNHFADSCRVLVRACCMFVNHREGIERTTVAEEGIVSALALFAPALLSR